MIMTQKERWKRRKKVYIISVLCAINAKRRGLKSNKSWKKERGKLPI